VDGYVAAQLISSILAVSAVTVAFCSNMLMVQDRANGSFSDLAITPARRELFAVGYYAASLISTLIICLIASAVCLIYSAIVGFYMSFVDILLMLCDVIMLVMFGTAISSVINFFLKTQGQISAVGSIVSSCYGFVCGAYMPISQFSEGLRNVVSCLPGTYGTSLLRNHCMRGVIAEMEVAGVPVEAIDGLRDAVDINLYFFGERVSTGVMYAVLLSAIALFVAAYVIQNVIRGKRTA
jgi:multidrug/hemolysin transport system permease protein